MKILSLSLFLPHEGIAHAGGEYVLRHYRVLSKSAEVIAYAPGTAENIAAAELIDIPNVSAIAVGDHERAGRGVRFLRNLLKAARGPSLPFDMTRRLAKDPAFLKEVAEADIIDFQWTESASMRRLIHRLNPTAPRILVCHDVLTQRWSRAAEGRRPLKRIYYTLRKISAEAAERKIYSQVERVITFSEKDRAAILKLSPDAAVEVVPPSLVEPTMPSAAPLPGDSQRTPPAVLFTGALARPENHEAVMWLLDAVWPLVRQEETTAQLVIAGAGPTEDLVARAGREGPSVVLTGYVDSLDPYYREATVFVAPLLRGAGVKFKTIVAMLWGLPIVSTPIGAEGVGSPEHYVAITFDAEQFASSIVRALRGENTANIAAFSWANETFGWQPFVTHLLEIYRLSPTTEQLEDQATRKESQEKKS